MKGIYRFYWENSPCGLLEGIFVADSDDIESLVGAEVQIDGVGSHACGVVDEGDITLVTDDEDAVTMFEEHELECGWNPLKHQIGSSTEVFDDYVRGFYDEDSE